MSGKHEWLFHFNFLLVHFIEEKHLYNFYVPISSFHCIKLKLIFKPDPELVRNIHFGPKTMYLPKTSFLELIINITLMYFWVPLIM